MKVYETEECKILLLPEEDLVRTSTLGGDEADGWTGIY